MAKRSPKADTADTKALQTKSAQDAQRLMASVTAIKPEWHEAGHAISQLYKQQRQDMRADSGLPVGRLAVLADPDYVASILAGIDAGSTPSQAAVAIGGNHQTVIDHIAQGEKDIQAGLYSAHRLFAEQCQRAKERRRQRLLQRIEAAGEAGPQFWTAPAWLLERGYGGDYKLQQDRGGASVVVNVGIISQGDVRIGGESPLVATHNTLDGVVIPDNT